MTRCQRESSRSHTYRNNHDNYLDIMMSSLFGTYSLFISNYKDQRILYSNVGAVNCRVDANISSCKSLYISLSTSYLLVNFFFLLRPNKILSITVLVGIRTTTAGVTAGITFFFISLRF